MASPEFLAEVATLVKNYQPNDAVVEYTADWDIVTVSGPPDVGTNSVIQSTGLDILTGWTSEPQRDSPDSNCYKIIETVEQEQALLASLAAGDLVRAAINPTTGHFYGGGLDDYNFKGVGLLDVAPQEYRHFVQQGLFRSIHAVYLTAPRNIWRARLASHDVRVANDADYRMKRFQEAADSLSFSLDHSDDYYFILNDYLKDAVQRLKEFALSDKRDVRAQLLAKQAGITMLKGLSDLSLA